MSIDRVPKVPFAQIANAALRDKRLSFKARGILAMVLSHSGEWNAGREFIVSQSDHDGKDAVQSALNELTALGYRKVVKNQKNDGTWESFVQWSHHPSDSRETDRPEIRLPVDPATNRTPSENISKNTPDASDDVPVKKGERVKCPYCHDKFVWGKPHNCSANNMLMR